jgi:ferredoxin
MAHVISSKCISEVYAACQMVCPADCMNYVAALPQGYPAEGQPMMVIDAGECIDCGACAPECPIDAIIPDTDTDAYWAQINANLGPAYKGQKAAARPKNEPPRRPDNQLR